MTERNVGSRRHGRRYFLSDVPVEEAVRTFHVTLDDCGAMGRAASEDVTLEEALGRVTAKAVWAKASSPHYDSAAMDGVAVRSRETAGATETSPLRLSVDRQVVWVDTGDPMPPGFDAVIMVEVVHEVDDSTIEILAPAPPYQHVRPLGEDIVATELVLPENHCIRPVDLGACAAAGVTTVAVRKRPTVAIIPTGSELVQPGAELKPGDIVEYNGLVIAGMVREWGGEPARLPPVADDRDAMAAAVTDAVREYDIVIVNAGSSAGSEDYTADVVRDLGDLLVHGVALRPGHPVVLGVVDSKPVLGIPGYPVSAALTSELFVKPLIEVRLGLEALPRAQAKAILTRNVSSPMGEDELLRVRLGRVGGRMVATPVQRGAGVITSLVKADGMVTIPRFSEGVASGEAVTVELLRPLRDVERTVVVIGSHDPALDLLADMVSRVRTYASVSSSNVGSLGGLLALNRGEAHAAGVHLLDETTGEYNLSYVRRYVKGCDVVVMNLVKRIQGLIVPAGNPRGVGRLDDLAAGGVRFINRQRGSGTRMLLDYMLGKLGIEAGEIAGYDREEYTHLAVAAAVAGGRADVGLGILSAARALGVDFVPLLEEQYDLVIPAEFYESELLGPVLELVRGAEFRTELEAMGGYDTSLTGEVMATVAADRGG